MTITRILCPIDFSDASTHAVEQAAAVARWYGARIAALHVSPVGRAYGVPLTDTVSAALPAPAELKALEAQAAAACRAVTDAAIPLDISVMPGQPVEAILERAAALPADLIVMGTHGETGFERLLLGSVTEKVLRRAACPVLTVPPRAQATSSQPFKRVLCSVDFSECSLKALGYAASLAKESGAALTLLHVLEWPWHEPPGAHVEGVPPEQARALAEYRRYLEASALSELEKVAAAATAGDAATVQVRIGRPHAELLDAARETSADLIVLGVRGRNALDLGFFGSTTNHVVRSATCPVLTIPG